MAEAVPGEPADQPGAVAVRVTVKLSSSSSRVSSAMGMVRVARTALSGTLNVAGLARVSPGFAEPEKSYATLKDSPPAGAASLRVTSSEAFCPSEMSPRGMNPPGPEIEKVFVSCAGGGAA